MSFDPFRFAVGQTDICRFGPTGGQQYINENRYLAIERGKRIVYSTSLTSNGRVHFSGTVAVAFDAKDEATRMRLIEQGLDGHDIGNIGPPGKACSTPWTKYLRR